MIRFILLVISFVGLLIPAPLRSQDGDSDIEGINKHSVAGLKRDYPYAWEYALYVKKNSENEAFKWLRQMSGPKLIDMNNKARMQQMYLDNATDIEIVREGFTLSPYHVNYGYFDWITDPGRDGEDLGGRYALKFQISIK